MWVHMGPACGCGCGPACGCGPPIRVDVGRYGSGQSGSGGGGFAGAPSYRSRSAPARAYSTMAGLACTVREFVHAGMAQPNTRQLYSAMLSVNTRCRAAWFRLRVLIRTPRICLKQASMPHLLAYVSTSISGSLVAKAISFSSGVRSFFLFRSFVLSVIITVYVQDVL